MDNGDESKWPRGSETILLLDDDRLVCRTTARVLKQLGYSVLASTSPDEAITLAARHGRTIDLLLADVLMPGMSGPETALAIHDLLPGLPVLYVSGLDDLRALGPRAHVLRKPFTPGELATKLRDLLARVAAVAS
jgi:CheY-like chemotaxis protein